jgi:hypothetical protein
MGQSKTAATVEPDRTYARQTQGRSSLWRNLKLSLIRQSQADLLGTSLNCANAHGWGCFTLQISTSYGMACHCVYRMPA